MIQIKKNCVSRIKRDNCRIECSLGALWITYKNGDDIVLKAGDRAKIKNKRDIMIQGLTESKYIID